MTNNRLVSVIIPAYNSASCIVDAVDSVLVQTYKDYEIIIVDDGSTDDTAIIVRSYISSVDRRPEIRYIFQKNAGPSAARNRGIKEAKGQYIAFLDSDDTWSPDKLAKQVEHMEANKLKGLCCTGYNMVDESGAQVGVHQLCYKSKKDVLRALFIKNIVSTCSTVMISRECFDTVGMFDESLHVAEDWDMWIRIIRKYDFAHIPEPLANVMVRDGSQSSDGHKNLSNDLQFLNKLYADSEFKKNCILKAKSYSYRYYSAALAFKENGKMSDAKRCFLRSFAIYPFMAFRKNSMGLFLRLLFIK